MALQTLPRWTFSLQNDERLNLCCFKPPACGSHRQLIHQEFILTGVAPSILFLTYFSVAIMSTYSPVLVSFQNKETIIGEIITTDILQKAFSSV